MFDLTGGVPEKEESGVLAPPPGRWRRSFDSLLKTVEEARRDKDTKAFYVRFGSTTFACLARCRGAWLSSSRRCASTMPVHCHADSLGNSSLLVAARGCSKTITLAPSGGVEAVGLAAQVIHMHKLLTEELHVNIDILQVGKFKGAEEPLTRDGPSPEARGSRSRRRAGRFARDVELTR